MGCRLSDHSLEPVVYSECSDEEASEIFEKAMNGWKPEPGEADKYRTNLLTFLGARYSELGWVMQLHIGCMRNNNSRQFGLLGPDTGFDAIDDTAVARPLSRLLDKIDTVAGLPKTILYCPDPGANETISVIAGCFQGGGIPGKVQHGLVVQRPPGRHEKADDGIGFHRPAEQVRRDADRFEEFFVIRQA